MSVTPAPVQIRPIATIAEYRACQDLQRRTWGITEDGYVVPVATMVSVQHAGGLVLGAFSIESGNERLAGFAFAYLGRVGGYWALYSQIAAVDGALQAQGVGGMLKHAQRNWARDQSLALVAWSFDPLQAGNASFNLHRLGAFARTYYINLFGDRSDSLNAGLDSDRLVAEWPVVDAERHWLDQGEPPLDLVRLTPQPACNWDAAAAQTAAPLAIAIPPKLTELRAADLPRLRTWQVAVREAFSLAFAAGYVAVDVRRSGEGGASRVSYLLRRPADSGALVPPAPSRPK